MINILIDMDINKDGMEQLNSIPNVNVEFVEPASEKRELPEELIKDKHILFSMFPPSNIDLMKSLEFIQINSAGYSQLFNLGLVEKGVKACNARGVFDVPIAEWCASMMINLARDLRGMVRNQEARVWDRSARFQKEIRGSTAGIWGYGSIGRETARMAKAMGMKVYAMDQSTNLDISSTNSYRVEGTGDPEGAIPEKVFKSGQEEEFLKDLDFLILCMPLTKNTEGIIGENELKYLPQKAFILNPARGQLIKEEALIKALRNNWVSGAALDTHYYYPMPKDHPIWEFPNVIMTPHISGSTLSQSFNQRIWEIFTSNVKNFIDKKPLLNEITASQLKGK